MIEVTYGPPTAKHVAKLARNKARWVAMRRVTVRHPTEFREFYRQELAKVGQVPRDAD